MSLYNSIDSYQLIATFNNMISITVIMIYFSNLYTQVNDVMMCLSLHIID